MKDLLVFSSSRSEYYILNNLFNEFKLKKIKFKIFNIKLKNQENYFDKSLLKNIIYFDLKKLNLLKKNFNPVIQRIIPKIKKFKYVIIYGDRVEAYLFAQACFFANVKIIHFGGGDLTYGSLDNKYRYLISLLSEYHFVTNNESKENLKKVTLSKYIYNTGYMYPEISNKKNKLNKDVKNLLKNDFFLVTYHPNTLLKKNENVNEIHELIKALELFKKNFYIYFTYPNDDRFSEIILQSISAFTRENNNVFLFQNLGKLYPIFLKKAKLVIGNSSSGIYEAPYYKKITINIGERQKGRNFGESIITSNANKIAIKKAILEGLKAVNNKNINYTYKKSSLSRVSNIILGIINENENYC